MYRSVEQTFVGEGRAIRTSAREATFMQMPSLLCFAIILAWRESCLCRLLHDAYALLLSNAAQFSRNRYLMTLIIAVCGNSVWHEISSLAKIVNVFRDHHYKHLM